MGIIVVKEKPVSDAFYNLKQVQWWKQQIWTLTTESLFGLLAAIAIINGKSIFEIGLAFCLLSFSSAAVLRYWHASFVSPLFCFSLILGSLWFFGPLSLTTDPWWGWVVCCGILMGVRDVSAIYSITKLYVSYRREGIHPFSQQKWSMLWGLIFFVIGMSGVGYFINSNHFFANIIILIASFVGIFPMIFEHHEIKWWRPVSPFQWKSIALSLYEYREKRNERKKHFSSLVQDELDLQKKILNISNFFHPIQIVGKRLLLPILILMFTNEMGWEKGSIALLGSLLGLMSLTALLKSKKNSPLGSLSKGINYSLIGWFLVGIGFLGSVVHSIYWLSVGMLGWILVEVFVRSWGAGLMELLRALSGPRQHYRYHQRILQKFFLYKSIANGVFFLIFAFCWSLSENMTAVIFILATLSCFYYGNKKVVPFFKLSEKLS